MMVNLKFGGKEFLKFLKENNIKSQLTNFLSFCRKTNEKDNVLIQKFILLSKKNKVIIIAVSFVAFFTLFVLASLSFCGEVALMSFGTSVFVAAISLIGMLGTAFVAELFVFDYHERIPPNNVVENQQYERNRYRFLKILDQVNKINRSPGRGGNNSQTRPK